MAEEWGDFSHHRPVTLPDGTRHPAFLGGPDHDIARGAVLALAADYFDLGYDTIGWKISEGTGYEDPTWASAYAEAKRRGKRFVGYHFDRAAFDGAAQFDWFISRWLAVAGSLRPGLDVLCHDVEDTNSPAGARASMLRFTGRATSRGYPTGVIYSGVWYAGPNDIRLDDIPTAGWRRGWLSDYTAGQADSAIELPPGWPRSQVVARQYTSTHPWPGMTGGVDFNRTLAAWPAAGGDWFDMATNADLAAVVDERLAWWLPRLAGYIQTGGGNNGFGEANMGAAWGHEMRRAVDTTAAKVGAQADDQAALTARMDSLAAGLASTLTQVRNAQTVSADAATLVQDLITQLVAAVELLAPGGSLDLDDLARRIAAAISGSIITVTQPMMG
jgi:GH25 family lysozyme M1 (1,4-beta-N-acetylmuramidase)